MLEIQEGQKMCFSPLIGQADKKSYIDALNRHLNLN